MIVQLCVHGEAKPHRVTVFEGAEWWYEDCPGGRVLEGDEMVDLALGAIEDDQLLVEAIPDRLLRETIAIGLVDKMLDALASAQEQTIRLDGLSVPIGVNGNLSATAPITSQPWVVGVSMSGIYWVHIDFGSDHEIRRCSERPGSEWVGPFGTWTAAKNHIFKAGADEIAEIRRNLALWRTTRKDDALASAQENQQ